MRSGWHSSGRIHTECDLSRAPARIRIRPRQSAGRTDRHLQRPACDEFGEGRPSGEASRINATWSFRQGLLHRAATTGARLNLGLRDTAQRHGFNKGEFALTGLYYRGGTNKNKQVRFHPNLPLQDRRALWSFDGTFPSKLLQVRYGEPGAVSSLQRPADRPCAQHRFRPAHDQDPPSQRPSPAESDGDTNAFFFPGQYYDYRWPLQLAGYDTINTDATDPRAAFPTATAARSRFVATGAKP